MEFIQKCYRSTYKPCYLPGEEVSGTLKANYFFEKPVAEGTAAVEINTVDIGVTKLTELKGKTDGSGDYKFKYVLPKSFVGQPFEQGKAVFELHATLKDTADHRQESRLSVPVVKEPILIVIVPESRSLVPGVENRVYIAAATPDGAALNDLKTFVQGCSLYARLLLILYLIAEKYPFDSISLPETRPYVIPSKIRF